MTYCWAPLCLWWEISVHLGRNPFPSIILSGNIGHFNPKHAYRVIKWSQLGGSPHHNNDDNSKTAAVSAAIATTAAWAAAKNHHHLLPPPATWLPRIMYPLCAPISFSWIWIMATHLILIETTRTPGPSICPPPPTIIEPRAQSTNIIGSFTDKSTIIGTKM